MAIKTHPYKKWEVSILTYRKSIGTKFKVTRRLPVLNVSETKVFSNKDEAKRLFDEWLE